VLAALLSPVACPVAASPAFAAAIVTRLAMRTAASAAAAAALVVTAVVPFAPFDVHSLRPRWREVADRSSLPSALGVKISRARRRDPGGGPCTCAARHVRAHCHSGCHCVHFLVDTGKCENW
jgi:hypothetical protein